MKLHDTGTVYGIIQGFYLAMHRKTIPLYNSLYRYVSVVQCVKNMKVYVHPYPGTNPSDTYHYMMVHKPEGTIGYPSFWYGVAADVITYRVWIHNNAGVLIQPI